MTTKCKVLCASLLVLIFCSGAPSDDKAPGKNAGAVGKTADKNSKVVDKAPDKTAGAVDKTVDKNLQAVDKALESLAKALNARDPKAISELFTPTGEFIDPDANVFDSHEAIAAEFTALFENNRKKNTVELAAEEIREISPGILSVDCVATFSSADDADTEDIDFSTLLVKQSDGRWLLASVRSEGEGKSRTPHARLKQLEWLIGEWVDESHESTMHTTTQWSKDGHFILTDFTIHVAGRQVMSGTQRIGWDGSLAKFKSWVFDSEGGHAEGIWTEIDDRWIVKATGVRPDGDACSATQTYEQRGADSYLFTVTERIVGNETAPDFTSQVVRKPPEPVTASATTVAPPGK